MRIDKAIERLENYTQFDASCYYPELYQAIKLGIEALQQLKRERDIYGFERHFRLPGETEE